MDGGFRELDLRAQAQGAIKSNDALFFSSPTGKERTVCSG